MDTRETYRMRFTETDKKKKEQMWQVLVRHYLQQYVKKDFVVLDLGAGYCEFINNIVCGKKYAVDVNPEVKNYADAGVEALVSKSTEISIIPENAIDLVFCSNFFEHLPDREIVLKTLQEVKRILKPQGLIIVISPNISYVRWDFWNFFDHMLPFNHQGFCEALAVSGFEIKKVVPRFLPYTTKSRLPQSSHLFRFYLRFSWCWRLFGKQMLIVAEKR
ncbi:MAG: class I SAM-dependent methyltransferase [Candidatus Omnitrophica bacterium]|nr:class I SAM-dependent methyltransferase [Candidatus Omnitrophota bacterium]